MKAGTLINETVRKWSWWKEMLTIVVGCVIVSVGFVFFINPYNIVPGGVYGLGIVMHNIFPSVQVGTFGYMFDVPLLITAIFIFGRQFGGRTLFAACMTPGLMNILSSLAYPSREALQALDPSQLLGGVLDLLLGIFLCCYPQVTLVVLPVVLGIWLIYHSFMIIGFGGDLSSFRLPGAGWTMVGGIMMLVMGLLMVIMPLTVGVAAIALVTGSVLIVTGLLTAALSLKLRRLHDNVHARYPGPDYSE